MKKNFKHYLLSRREIESLLGDRFGPIQQTIYVGNALPISDLFIIISQLFDHVELTSFEDVQTVTLERDKVRVRRRDPEYLTVCWLSSFENDSIGDCLSFMLNSVGELDQDLLQPFVQQSRGHRCHTH